MNFIGSPEFTKLPKPPTVLELYKNQIYKVPKELISEYLIELVREFGNKGISFDDSPLYTPPDAILDIQFSKSGLFYCGHSNSMIRLGEAHWTIDLHHDKIDSHIKGFENEEFNHLLELAKAKSNKVKYTKILEQFEVEVRAGEVWFFTLEELYRVLEDKGIQFEDLSPIHILAYDRNCSHGKYVSSGMMKALDGTHYSFYRRPGIIGVIEATRYEISG